MTREERRQYILDTFYSIASNRNQPRISDAAMLDEHRALNMLKAAYAQFKSAAQDAMALTDLRKDAIQEMLAYADDSCPDFDAWEESISDVRRYGT